MTLTQDRLKQIIKEELEAIMNEVEEVNLEDAAVASLEKQLAEAKAKAAKAKMKKGQTVGKRGTDPNTYKMNKVSPKINGNAGKTGKVKK